MIHIVDIKTFLQTSNQGRRSQAPESQNLLTRMKQARPTAEAAAPPGSGSLQQSLRNSQQHGMMRRTDSMRTGYPPPGHQRSHAVGHHQHKSQGIQGSTRFARTAPFACLSTGR